MFDQTSTPAQKPRRLLLIVLSLIAVMIIMLMLWRNFTNPPSVKWSVLLENISKGDVAKISVGPESAKVTAAKKAGGHEYHVSYLNARFGEAGPKELNEEIRAYNLTAKEKNVLPIETVSAEPAGALSQILPPLLGIGLLIWAFYFFVLRRMGHGDGAMPFGKNREPFNTSQFETGENRRNQSWFSRWQQRRATRARERQEREESEEQLILDRLLVKVSEQGLPSLTAAERSSLQRISRKQKERQGTGV